MLGAQWDITRLLHRFASHPFRGPIQIPSMGFGHQKHAAGMLRPFQQDSTGRTQNNKQREFINCNLESRDERLLRVHL